MSRLRRIYALGPGLYTLPAFRYVVLGLLTIVAMSNLPTHGWRFQVAAFGEGLLLVGGLVWMFQVVRYVRKASVDQTARPGDEGGDGA